jgi:hypothetical protein
MCTVVILRRPGHDWPLILAANRDEMLSRPWLPPARHWPDRADVVAGLDQLAGGTWMGMNESGVLACILNRHGTLGPATGKRSRGELVLEALDHADAADAAEALAAVDPTAYRPFNMVIADNRDAWWIAAREGARVATKAEIGAGVSMLTAGDLNDMSERRIALFHPRFSTAPHPDPARGDWKFWSDLMSSKGQPDAPYDAMNFLMDSGFGTSSSSLVALPSPESLHEKNLKPIWLFAAGRPDSAAFRPVAFS